MKDCTDCDYPGNGKCSSCHGGGREGNPVDAFSKALAGEDQACEECNGSGDCPTCDGKGYLDD